MLRTFYESPDFCDAFSDMQNINLNVTIMAFSELVAGNSAMRDQGGKHYQKAVAIFKQQIAYILADNEKDWTGYVAFEPMWPSDKKK